MSPFLTTLGGGSVRGFGRSFRRSVAVAAPGQQAYTSSGTYTFVVPAGVTSVSAVVVSGGDGGHGSGASAARYAGNLRYVNNRSVTPGESLTVVVGNGGVRGAAAQGGAGSTSTTGGSSYVSQAGSPFVQADQNGTNIGSGGDGGINYSNTQSSSAGGGAGGYTGAGGAGGSESNNGGDGTGGAAGGGKGGPYSSDAYYEGSPGGAGGGGVGILGTGSSGAGGTTSQFPGGGGSSGSSGYFPDNAWNSSNGDQANAGGGGGLYGGAGGAGGYKLRSSDGLDYWSSEGADGARGAVRIIWGAGRSYPSAAANV